MRPNEGVETVSVSPNDNRNQLDWGGNLPEIPSTTDVFWPSIMVGLLCTLFGVYLVLNPVPLELSSAKDPSTPLPSASKSPDGPTPGEVTKVLRLSFVDSKDSTFALAMEEFARLVSERTDGELAIELLPGGLVDGRKLAERELVEAVQNGELTMALSTTSPLSNFNHILDVIKGFAFYI